MSVNLEESGHLDKADCKNIGDFCPDGNKISDPIEGEKFLERLSDSQLPKIVSFSWSWSDLFVV